MIEAIKRKIEDDINSIAKSWGVKNPKIEFDDKKLSMFFLDIEYEESKDSSSLQFAFLEDLVSKGYNISLVFANKIKGLRLYIIVKRKF